MKTMDATKLIRSTTAVLGEAQADIVCITRYNRPAFYVINAGDWRRHFEPVARAVGLLDDEGAE